MASFADSNTVLGNPTDDGQTEICHVSCFEGDPVDVHAPIHLTGYANVTLNADQTASVLTILDDDDNVIGEPITVSVHPATIAGPITLTIDARVPVGYGTQAALFHLKLTQVGATGATVVNAVGLHARYNCPLSPLGF